MLAQPAQGATWVLDLDCTLEPFPCTLEQYRQHTLLGAGGALPVQYQRWAAKGTSRSLPVRTTYFP